MKATHGGIGLLILLSACSGKKRPFADGPLPALSSKPAGGSAASAGLSDAGPASAPESPSLVSEKPDPVGALDLAGEASASGNRRLCEADAATACAPPEADAGPPPVVCVPAPRDCTSTLDIDCDGRPDNTIDDFCRCLPGTAGACDEHPGFDGRGPCTAGSRRCVAGEGNISSDWGPCEGAVGPAPEDSCAVRANDSDCDGQPGEGCSCVDGETDFCGPNTDNGICQRGTVTCVGGTFGQCVGAVSPMPRDCRSSLDNDCDGRPDNTIDGFCTCAIGMAEACAQHPGQDGVGQCRSGSRLCVAGANNSSSFFGQCNDSVGPAPSDACTSVNDADCSGVDNDDCDCVSSRGNSDCRGDANNARCNGRTGQCGPCQSDADCSLIADRDSCEAGECISSAPPLDCSAPSPPQTPIPTFTILAEVAPAPTGGVIADGAYLSSQVRFYDVDVTSVVGEAIEFRQGSFNRGSTTYATPSGDPLAGFHEAGTYVTTGSSLALEGFACSVPGMPRSPQIWGYSVSGAGLELFRSAGGRVTSVSTFARQ